jgi:hypothetical protein
MITQTQFKKLLEKSALKKPVLLGKRGEGKSQFIKDYATANLLKLNIINLSAIEAADFCGLPYIEDGQTKHARPSFFDCDLLFLDEIDRVQDQSVKSSLLSLFIDGKINGHEFKGYICGAGNGTTDGNNETSEFDDAMTDRLLLVPFNYNTDQKIAYLESKYGTENNLLKYFKAKYSIFEDLSTRSIDYSLQFHDDMNILKLCLNRELLQHYELFLSNLVVSLYDLISGKSFEGLTSMTKISLSHDVAANLEKISSCDKKSIKHINSFINSLAAEEKSSYFLLLQKKALADSSFRALAKKLDSLGFFAEQADFLKELGK